MIKVKIDVKVTSLQQYDVPLVVVGLFEDAKDDPYIQDIEEIVKEQLELGDFKDQDKPPAEKKTLSYLQAVEKVLKRFNGPTYHVLGNHDLDSISKEQFLKQVDNTNIDSNRSYYSFDSNGLHHIVLDANYRTDGADYERGNFDWTDANIHPKELDWLKQDLTSTPRPVILFIHQLLDGTGSVYVKNAAQRVLDQVAAFGSPQDPYTFSTSKSTYDAGGDSQAYNTGLSIVAYHIMFLLAEMMGEISDGTLQSAQEILQTAEEMVTHK